MTMATETKFYGEEASTLGLKPGEWPVTLMFRGVQWTRGKAEYIGHGEDSELGLVYYYRPGAVLEVYND